MIKTVEIRKINQKRKVFVIMLLLSLSSAKQYYHQGCHY